ncbi:unnamed protein product [Staurois parvus]|uniref:Uncharacterized protein n=1 Tax=Staurois parvus TaxID=386267 RepID=A0ABN9GTV5_9NEOB|nr:unnamed protein product [Staurois parvus]
MQPHLKDIATATFNCRDHAFFFVLLTFAMPYSFEAAISSKNIYLGFITSEYRVPVVVFFFQHGPWQILGWLFCAWVLGEVSFLDNTHACHSSAKYAVLCHRKQSPQFGYLLL